MTTGVVVCLAIIVHISLVKYKINQSLAFERVRLAERDKAREQVSRDYHDEIGHKITKISIFSEIIKRNINGGSKEIVNHLNKRE